MAMGIPYSIYLRGTITVQHGPAQAALEPFFTLTVLYDNIEREDLGVQSFISPARPSNYSLLCPRPQAPLLKGKGKFFG